MSLDVNIFWVDNEPGWLDAAVESLGDLLRDEWGLRLVPHTFTSHEEASKAMEDALPSGFGKYDMVLIDYDLGKTDGESKTGDALVGKLRDAEVYTEVIFYSVNEKDAQNDLIRKNLALSGIYFVPRADAEAAAFVERCRPRMSAILSKVLDLTRMRGIMVAEMSAIETDLLPRLVMSRPEFQQIAGEEFMRVVREAHDNRAKARASDLAQINGSGQSARDLLKNKDIFRATVSWSVMLHFAKEFADKGKIKEVNRSAGKLRRFRNNLSHLTDSELKEEREEQQKEFLKIRKDILACKQLLEDAFPDP